MSITQTFGTFLAQLDLWHHVWGALRAVQFGARRKRKHHKLTAELRGVAGIEFVDNQTSGFGTCDLLSKYGIPAWTGAVLGIYREGEQTVGTALRMHVPGSQERLARYMLKRHGVLLLDDDARGAVVDAQRPLPVAWADRRGEFSPRDRQSRPRAPRAGKRGARDLRHWFDL